MRDETFEAVIPGPPNTMRRNAPSTGVSFRAGRDPRFQAARIRVNGHELDRFEAGRLFFYISSTGQCSHMFWRLRDPSHPAYDARLTRDDRNTIPATHQERGQLLAELNITVSF